MDIEGTVNNNVHEKRTKFGKKAGIL